VEKVKKRPDGLKERKGRKGFRDMKELVDAKEKQAEAKVRLT